MLGSDVTHGQYIPLYDHPLNRNAVSDNIQLGRYIYQQIL